MEMMISFRCQACGRTLKVRADKAGRRARCKCGAEVLIPAAPQPAAIPLSEGAPRPADGGTIPLAADPPAAARAPAAPSPSTPRLRLEDDEETKPPPGPAAPPPPATAEDEEEGTYGLNESFDKPAAEADEEEEDEDEEDETDGAAAKEEEQEEEALRARRKRLVSTRKVQLDEKQWRKVQLGLTLLGAAVGTWAVAFCLHCLFVLIGSQTSSEYAYLASNELVYADQAPVPGQSRSLDRPDFLVGLVIGSNLFVVGKVLLILAVSVVLIELILAGVGFLMCQAAPAENGCRPQARAGLILAAVNFFLVFVLQLLPLTGLLRWVMIPFFLPEVAMVAANINRIEPIQVAWGGAPYADVFFGLLFQTALLAQPVLIASFLRAVAKTLKIESLQQVSESLIRLGGGTAFAWAAYLMMTSTGTSDVLLMVVRVVYGFATVFLLGELIWLTFVLLRSRVGIDKVLKVGWVA